MEVGDAGNVIQKQELPYHNEGVVNPAAERSLTTSREVLRVV